MGGRGWKHREMNTGNGAVRQEGERGEPKRRSMAAVMGGEGRGRGDMQFGHEWRGKVREEVYVCAVNGDM